MTRLTAALLALALAGPALAQTDVPPVPPPGPPSPAQPATLRVIGEGMASAEPDMATVRIGVENQAPAPAAALRENTEAVSRVIDEIIAAGVPEKDIQTANFSVYPVYDQRPMEQGEAPKVAGFRVTNEVVAKIRDLDGIGAVLSAVVEAGANQINALSFGLEDDAALRDEARRRAMQAARRSAEVYAEAAGVSLGRVLSIDEGYVQPPQPMPGQMMRMEAMDSAAPVPIQRGETSIGTQVTVVWEIAPAG